jgi:hypothetical protein
MNINDILDAGDFDAFALGMRSTSAYRASYFGEFPVTRGSLDGIFDFDDISWFLNHMDENGALPGGAGAGVGQIPEPAATVPTVIGIAMSAGARRMRFHNRRAR